MIVLAVQWVVEEEIQGLKWSAPSHDEECGKILICDYNRCFFFTSNFPVI
jgi:hypothetical protein